MIGFVRAALRGHPTMKNVLPVFALLISISGIALSLGREEVRCYLGLESTGCPGKSTRETEPRSIGSPRSKTTRTVGPEPRASPPPASAPAPEPPISSGTLPEDTAPLPTGTAENKTSGEPSPEVVPSPELSPESVPLEVIPPPEPSGDR
jgi:hypothetical protein